MSETPRTVLIVDDEPQVLHLVEKMLRPRNFRIQVAPKPSEALRIAEGEPVHLLISDISLPEMDGHKLTEEVLKLHPEAGVLLISGLYQEKPGRAKSGRIKFLSKPFFPSDLLRMVRELFPDV
ncbi:MAG: response regulator [Acidobacteriia bacterium]|nr:response regulator [Terriglobia bacterium]